MGSNQSGGRGGNGGKGGGQRGNLSSSSGRKQRSPTMSAHAGSREEPSHVADKARAGARKSAARGAKKKG